MSLLSLCITAMTFLKLKHKSIRFSATFYPKLLMKRNRQKNWHLSPKSIPKNEVSSCPHFCQIFGQFFLLMFGQRCSYLDKCTHVTDMTSSRGLKSQANASMLRGIGRSRSARFYIFESTSEKKSYKHTFCQCNSKMTLTRIEWQSVKNPVTF